MRCDFNLCNTSIEYSLKSDSPVNNLAAVALLLALNGFFVAAQFALVKARGFRPTHGSPAAWLTLRIQANLEGYLAACRLGISMASLGLGWVGEPVVAAVLKPAFVALGVPAAALHSCAFLLGFLLFAALHAVLGEQLPRSFAIRRAEQVAVWVAYPLHCIYLVLWPLNWLLDNTSRAILSFFKEQAPAQGEVSVYAASTDNVSESHDHGNFRGHGNSREQGNSYDHGDIEQDKSDQLRNLLEFDQLHAGCIMLPRKLISVLDVAAAQATNQRTVMQSEHSRLPLIDSNNADKLLGVVAATVIYHALLEQKPPWHKLKSYCQMPLIVLENHNTAQLFELMRVRQQSVAFVVNEYGSLCGMVTLQNLLEEIAADI